MRVSQRPPSKAIFRRKLKLVDDFRMAFPALTNPTRQRGTATRSTLSLANASGSFRGGSAGFEVALPGPKGRYNPCRRRQPPVANKIDAKRPGGPTQ